MITCLRFVAEVTFGVTANHRLLPRRYAQAFCVTPRLPRRVAEAFPAIQRPPEITHTRACESDGLPVGVRAVRPVPRRAGVGFAQPLAQARDPSSSSSSTIRAFSRSILNGSFTMSSQNRRPETCKFRDANDRHRTAAALHPV